jgi:hypothetical protein
MKGAKIIMDKTNLVKLTVDTIHNKVEKYSREDATASLRQMIIDANGGSTELDRRSFQRYPELYEIMETMLPVIIQEGFKGDEFFNSFIDYRNLSLGDDERFWTEDTSLFLVSEQAAGNMSIRRQRLNAGSYTTIARSLKGIKIYEELNRLISGRVDFNVFVDRLTKSYNNRVYNDIYSALDGISASTSGMSSTYYKTGSFAEDTLLGIIDHVEAAMNGSAKIIGTRSALRKVTSAVVSDQAKNDMYAMGYYGKFNGTEMIVAKQRHRAGTSDFALSDSKIYVVAGDEKFIKMVDEGRGILEDNIPMNNGDMTKEYYYGQIYGCGVLLTGKLGIYSIS